MTAVLRIDDKWSVEYDPENNDKPMRVLRYNEDMKIYPPKEWHNDVIAMFHALLEARRAIEVLVALGAPEPK